MSRNPSTVPVVQAPAELLQDICAPHILPDESADAFDALRQALFGDLAPSTPYEHLLAEQLVALEWEVLRYRRMRDALLKAEFRRQASDAFRNAENSILASMMTGEDPSAYDLVSDDPARREIALATLAELEIPLAEIMAKAYRELASDLAPHERQIAEAEIRRRRLREDYGRLKALRAAPVEEAVEIAP